MTTNSAINIEEMEKFIVGEPWNGGDENPTININITKEAQRLLQGCVKQHLPFDGWQGGDGDEGHIAFQHRTSDWRYWIAGVFEEDVELIDWPVGLEDDMFIEELFELILFAIIEYAERKIYYPGTDEE